MEPPPVRYTTTSDGKRLAYTVSGRGRPLVLVPNTFMHAYWVWLQYPEWFAGLAQRFRFVHFNYRGQGMSTRGLAQDHSIKHWQLDLETVMDAAHVESAVLVGVGHSCHIAVRFALEHPERVEALVLNGPAIAMNAWSNSMMLGVSAENWELYLRSTIPRQVPPEMLDVWEKAMRETQTQAEFQVAIREIFRWNLDGELGRLQIPTLVLHPRQFVALPVDEPQRFAAAIPDARFVLTEGTGTASTQADALAAIDSFLSGVPHHELNTNVSLDSQRNEEAGWWSARLTPREIEVLRLIVLGRSNQRIADELVLSVRTVERHITNLYTKIGAHGKAEATAYALRRGLA
jgi:pimeloyl-ACP methyl ester carboxylesterase/DNA-binding CsgD family transcriptional regulator